MATQDFKRKLTAILSADAKGYSRLMGEDEGATVRTITAYREIIGTIVQKHRGRVVDSPGDNILAEYASVVDAVQSAVKVQEELKTRNAELPGNRRMEFRIGINLGDVIQAGERIYGEGVNIAARIEGLAEGGGICVSRSVFDQVKKKLPLGYEYLGEHAVKNIEGPVRVYRVLMEPEFVGKVIGEKSPETEDVALPLPKMASIAVLPFTNMTGDTEQEYFSDGLTEEIITNLSKISRLFVIARNSVFTYKGKSVNVQHVGQELGVRYVLEGSIRKSGNRLRITAQLIDTSTGHHLWAERYDRDSEDIFALQDEITLKIISALQVQLTDGEQAIGWTKGAKSIEAYVKWMKGRNTVERFTKGDNTIARQMAKEIIALDPEYPRGYRLLATTNLCDGSFGWSKSPRKSLEQAAELYHKVIEMDESETDCRAFLAYTYTLLRQNDQALAEGTRAVDFCPNSADAHVLLGMCEYWAGNLEEAIFSLEKAIRLNPFPPGWYFLTLAYTYRDVGRYEEAIAEFKKVLHLTPDNLRACVGLAAAYSLAGLHEEANITVLEVFRINPTFTLKPFVNMLPYKNNSDREVLIQALHKVGLR